ncbi:MAG TPA: radical SAM protein [Caulobacteraceae bacterium]|nr:radical SAM protein [Caulobacteraceae bacterium]
MNQTVRPSPFVSLESPRLDPAKFRDPLVTAKGEERARVGVKALTTLWFNTGTLCNLTCLNCYIESSPTNDALAYLTAAEARAYLDEIAALGLPVREIGFTGGEPFMNPDILPMIGEALARGFEVLVLTNAMKPMEHRRAGLLALKNERLTIRVSLDHHTAAVHEAERGAGTWARTIEGLQWLAREGFSVAVAGRRLTQESEAEARAGYAALLARLGLPAGAPLVLFPEMDAGCDVPEITTACWGILGKSPDDLMCASSRMVVKRRGAERPVVTACTLTPYEAQFELGSTLAEALGEVPLNHPHCAKFCVLGGASCSA